MRSAARTLLVVVAIVVVYGGCFLLEGQPERHAARRWRELQELSA